MKLVVSQEVSSHPVQHSDNSNLTINIRPARFSDVPAITRIKRTVWLATYPDLTAVVSREDLQKKDFSQEEAERRQLIQRPHYRYLVAESNAQLIGYCMGQKKDNIGVIKLMHVLPAWQGKGVGSRLMEALLAWFGSRHIELQVVAANQAAIKFYQKFGFKKTGVGRPIRLPNKVHLETTKMSRSSDT